MEFRLQQLVLSMVLLEGEWLLNNVKLSEPQLTVMQDKLQSLDSQSQLTSALNGQRAITFDWLYSQPGLRGATSLSFLNLMSDLIDFSRKPLGEAVKSANDIRVKLDLQTKTGPRWKRRQVASAATGAKNYNKAFDFYGTTAAQQKLLLIVIAAERYRVVSGHFPNQLSELVPQFLQEVPLDPFDGHAVRIYSQDDKFAVYCVGTDGTDDGGKDDEGFGKPDILVRHVLPKK